MKRFKRVIVNGKSVQIPNPELVALEDQAETVNHPKHYTAHPSGIECIDVVETMGFCVGNAIKYLWRAGLKGDAIEDLKKAVWYVEREIKRRETTADQQAEGIRRGQR